MALLFDFNEAQHQIKIKVPVIFTFLLEFSIEPQQKRWHINGYSVLGFSQQRQFKQKSIFLLFCDTSFDITSTMYFQALRCPSIKKSVAPV